MDQKSNQQFNHNLIRNFIKKNYQAEGNQQPNIVVILHLIEFFINYFSHKTEDFGKEKKTHKSYFTTSYLPKFELFDEQMVSIEFF